MSSGEKKHPSHIDSAAWSQQISQIKDQKKMCLWLVGLRVGFFLPLYTSKCLASIPLKPSPKNSTKMEFEKETPCQKYSQLSHLLGSVIKVSHLNTGFLPFFFTGWGFGWAAVWSQHWDLTTQSTGMEHWALLTPLGSAWVAAFLERPGWRVRRPALIPELPSPHPLWGGHARQGGMVPRAKGTGPGDGPSRPSRPRTLSYRSLRTSWMVRQGQ